jgi:hypothetical protein
MKRMNRLAAFAMLLSAAWLTGCKKEQELTTAEKQEFASAQATVEVLTEIQSLNSMVTSLPTAGNPGGRMAGIQGVDCGIITSQTDESTGYGTITIDFGTGQTCQGRLLKGKIIYTIGMGSSEETLLTMSAKFVGYEADGKKLDGKYVIGLSLDDKESSFVYKFKFSDAVLTYADGKQVKWNSDYLLKMKLNINQSNNSATLDLSMTGGVAGTTLAGKAFTANITSPLIASSSCQTGYTKGQYLIKVDGYADALLDFGNGECDKYASLLINGKSQRIEIGK